MIRTTIIWFGLIGSVLLFSDRLIGQERQPPPDTSFSRLTMDELLNAKTYYMQELEELIGEKNQLIQRGIEDGERLLPGADPKVVPDILVRLADLYYHQEKDTYLDRMRIYEDSLALRSPGSPGQPPNEPRLVFDRSMKLYQRIIDEFPESELADDAMYYKAFLFEETGENQKANALYRQIAENHPQSDYLPEAYMRLGEYHFNPPVNDIDQAIRYYQQVTQHRDSPRYPEALYKLGWSYYRLNRFAEAISYFTTLIDESTALVGSRPGEIKAGADLRNEAVEYIAVSFVDYGGPSKADTYLRQIGKPQWGQTVLKKMGDFYRVQKEDYMTAISAYEILLAYAPLAPDAPQNQKGIADCYRYLGDRTRAFEAQQKLFLQYRTGSIWWNQVGDERSQLQAYKLTEASLRENFMELLKNAESQNSLSLYEQAVEIARTYLDAFPEDLNALMVRWNLALLLDGKLQRYPDALQEYLTISMVYNGEAYENFAKEKGFDAVQDAALNAIVVADTLVQREYRQSIRPALNPEGLAQSVDRMHPVPFSEAEKWLIMAYDNYIKLLPYDAKTSVMLANAGALHYTHNQYNDALKYFKTLTRTFPQSDQANDVQQYILESYFGKGDFESAEALAKKLLGEGLSGERKKAVEKRLAESIFLRAQTFAEQNQPQQAAAEYLRLALEVPTADFADRAIFNAGCEYEKMHDYASAVKAYEMLRASYRGSNLLPDGLNNMAINYAALSDTNAAADCYRELYRAARDSTEAETALHNAFIYYTQARNWNGAIETGTIYTSRYPRSSGAPLVWFKTCEAYVQVNDSVRAARAYQGLADRFPGSMLGVEAGFRAGHIFMRIDSLDSAETAFSRAFLIHERLERNGREGNAFFAMEALFQAGLLAEKRYRSLHLTLPQEVLNERLKEKQELLRHLVEQFAKVAVFQSPRMPEALFHIGQVHEHFAEAWAGQEIPELEPTLKAVRQKDINDRAAVLYQGALSAYLSAAAVMEKQIRPETRTSEKALPDSLVASIRTWLAQTENKASEMLFRKAVVRARAMEGLLDAPVPPELKEMAKLEYRSQLLIKAISPMIQYIAEAHRRNLIVSDSLGLQGGWADSSRTRILTFLGFLPSEFEKLAFRSLSGYRSRYIRYRNELRRIEAIDSTGLADEMINFLELSKTYGQNALALRKSEFAQVSKTGFSPDTMDGEYRALVRFSLGFTDSLEALRKDGLEDMGWAAILFETQQDPKYEDMLSVFEDAVFFIDECSRTLLEQGYSIIAEFPEKAESGGWLAIRLVQMQPDRYAAAMNIQLENINLCPDSTWSYLPSEQPGWEKADFIPTGWHLLGNDSRPDTVSMGTGTERSFYLRRPFSIPGLPVSAEADFSDSTCVWYINGHPVEPNPKFESEGIKRYLRPEANVLAIHGESINVLESKIRLSIRYIPNRCLPKEP